MKYILLKNFLNRVAYNYYAKNLHESDPEYSKTKEFVNFLSLHSEWEQMLDNFNIILQDINNLFG